jgi:hypothetical protein
LRSSNSSGTSKDEHHGLHQQKTDKAQNKAENTNKQTKKKKDSHQPGAIRDSYQANPTH